MPEDTNGKRIFVLGLGNILFQDEGVGVRAVEYIQAHYDLPENVQLLDGGTLGLDLLTYFSASTHLLILDAVRSRQEPGSLIRLEGSEIPAALAQKMSMHQLGLQDLMAAALLRGTLPEAVVLWGLEPEGIDWGLDLTPRVTEVFPLLIRSAMQELAGWGVSARERITVD